MPGQQADVAVERLGDHAVGVTRPDFALGDDQLHVQGHSVTSRDSVTVLALRESVTVLALRDSVTVLALRASVTTAPAPSPCARRPLSRRSCKRPARACGRTCLR